jgi:hypothetical protein
MEVDDEDQAIRRRCVSDRYSDPNQFDSDSNTEMLDKSEEEEWQAELRALVRNGEATVYFLRLILNSNKC